METIISAEEAERDFAGILRHVGEGHRFLIMDGGRIIARIIPVDRDDTLADAAKEALLDRLQKQPPRNVGRWTRDELHDD